MNYLKRIYDLLGRQVVLLPIKAGTKRPQHKKWQETTFAKTQTAGYQHRLEKAPAIGVLLGAPSNGLCTVDLDADEVAEEFLKRNPRLRKSLITKGKRGCNIWLRPTNSPPPSTRLTFDGKVVGEWRANGNQTVCWGEHPDGGRYRFVSEMEPLTVDLTEIDWGPHTPPLSLFSESSASSKSSILSIYPIADQLDTNRNDAVARARQATKARKDLGANKDLALLYERYVERKFTPRQGERNSATVAMVTFLFRVVSEDVLRDLVMTYYIINQDVFSDSEEQHRQEMEAHLCACERNWMAELSSHEAELADALDAKKQAAFRICRDLAAHSNGTFFLGCNELGRRIRVRPHRAQAILNALEGLEVLTMIEKGTRYAKGVQAKATTWKWNGQH